MGHKISLAYFLICKFNILNNFVAPVFFFFFCWNAFVCVVYHLRHTHVLNVPGKPGEIFGDTFVIPWYLKYDYLKKITIINGKYTYEYTGKQAIELHNLERVLRQWKYARDTQHV